MFLDPRPMRSEKSDPERREPPDSEPGAILHPQRPFHFEAGRELATRLGYPTELLTGVSEAVIRRFTGVGYFFHLVEIRRGDRVVELGSGPGVDAYLAAQQTGAKGEVICFDLVSDPLGISPSTAEQPVAAPIFFLKNFRDKLPIADATVDLVMSNGVIHCVEDKTALFREIARILRPGGRMVIADVVTAARGAEVPPKEEAFWKKISRGTATVAHYKELLEKHGIRVIIVEDNPQYALVSQPSWYATRSYGIKSVSLLSIKQ